MSFKSGGFPLSKESRNSTVRRRCLGRMLRNPRSPTVKRRDANLRTGLATDVRLAVGLRISVFQLYIFVPVSRLAVHTRVAAFIFLTLLDRALASVLIRSAICSARGRPIRNDDGISSHSPLPGIAASESGAHLRQWFGQSLQGSSCSQHGSGPETVLRDHEFQLPVLAIRV